MFSATERAIARLRAGRSVRGAAADEGIAPSTLYRQLRRIGGVESRRIVIVGAGALGREILGWLRSDAGESPDVVFVDDTAQEAGGRPVVATVAGYAPQPGDAVLLAIADPTRRWELARAIDGAAWHTYAHASVVRGSCVVGAGSMLLPHALVSADTTLGRHTVVNSHCAIGHDVTVGDCCTLSSFVNLCGNVHVGDRVMFGSSAVVLPGVRIGSDAVVGAGSVVIKDVPARATVFGVPARVIA